MNFLSVVFAVVTVFVHLTVFVVESFLWLKPVIYERALLKTGAPDEPSYYEQAQILEVLFFNQGFYNLFLAFGGIAGLLMYRAGKVKEGVVLVSYMCWFALGAGLVLAYSTTAYLGAMVQGLPPFLALVAMYMKTGKEE
ncbi:MAG: DUF1304 domain-containing protein [Pseudomonadales bacterium]|nr:DUF1304 domain-containing protein [Pseudomonadales bacterium]